VRDPAPNGRRRSLLQQDEDGQRDAGTTEEQAAREGGDGRLTGHRLTRPGAQPALDGASQTERTPGRQTPQAPEHGSGGRGRRGGQHEGAEPEQRRHDAGQQQTPSGDAAHGPPVPTPGRAEDGHPEHDRDEDGAETARSEKRGDRQGRHGDQGGARDQGDAPLETAQRRLVSVPVDPQESHQRRHQKHRRGGRQPRQPGPEHGGILSR
jgi:hypothetical protein